MFFKCYKLKEIKVINIFNTSKVNNIEGIFEECNKLKNLKNLLPQLDEHKNPEKKVNIEKEKITIHFLSVDQFINHTISCFNTDIFSDIEEVLFEKYPQMKFRDNIYLYDGITLEESNKMKTLEENQIKDGVTILIYELENN